MEFVTQSSKYVLVTGASRGIGRNLAITLSKSGFVPILWGRNATDIKSTADICGLYAPNTRSEVVDVSSEASVNQQGRNSLQGLENLYAVIINAGVGQWSSFEEMDNDNWNTTLDTNLKGAYYTLKVTLPLLKKSNSSHIVAMGSDSSEFGIEHRTAYCASKWGLLGFMESLREEVRQCGIHVTNILVSRVDTYFRDQRPRSRSHALNVDDVTRIIMFLLQLPPNIEIRELKASSIISTYGGRF